MTRFRPKIMAESELRALQLKSAIILSAVAMILALWLTTIAQIRTEHNWAQHLGVERARGFARLLSEGVLRDIDETELIVDIINDRLARDPSSFNIESLDDIVFLSDKICGLQMMDINGKVLWSVKAKKKVCGALNSEYTRHLSFLENADIRVTSPSTRVAPGAFSFVFAKRVKLRDGNLTGFLVASQYFEDISTAYRLQEFLVPAAAWQVTTQGGAILSRSSEQKQFGKLPLQPPLSPLASAHPDRNNPISTNETGSAYFVESSTLQKYGLAVSVAIPWQAELANADSNRKQYLLFSLVTTVVLVAVTTILIFLARRVIADEKDMRIVAANMQGIAETDSITGLKNHYFLHSRLRIITLDRSLSGCISLLLIKLDNFKSLCDAFAQECGDEFLQSIAHRLKSAASQMHSVVRVDGEQFAILVESDHSQQEAIEIAKRISTVFDPKFSVAGGAWRVGISIGIATFGRLSQNATELFAHASIALLKASVGRTTSQCSNECEVYSEELHSRMLELAEWKQDIRYGLLMNEFVLKCHTLVEYHSGIAAGMEAVVRWHHPKKGELSGERFLPIAEECGYGPDIGELVAKKAIAAYKVWKTRAGRGSFLLLSISKAQMNSGGLPDLLPTLLRKAGLDTSELYVAVCVPTTYEESVGIDQLKRAGISVIVESTGLDLISANRRLIESLDGIRIDRNILNEIPNDEEARATVEGIVTEACRLKLDIFVNGKIYAPQISWVHIRQTGVIYCHGEHWPTSPTE